MTNRRTAVYVATLVYVNEPQLILLQAGKSHVVALAIASKPGTARFIATTVTKKNWQSYIDEQLDLRYLFEYATVRTGYEFDLMNMKNKKIVMMPWDGPFTEDVLPGPRFFARDHTEDDLEDAKIETDVESLLVDGEWAMSELGSFYSRYSDVYYFLATSNEYEDDDTPKDQKTSIENAYRDKAFRGGFSYVNLYEALSANRRRDQRLGIDEIQYASPGFMNINGEKEVFSETRKMISDFLANRKSARDHYNKLYQYLSKARLLPLAGDEYHENHPADKFIMEYTNSLANEISILNTDPIIHLAGNNTLVYAKIILSFHRRLDEASNFFAQGRVTFSQSKRDGSVGDAPLPVPLPLT